MRTFRLSLPFEAFAFLEELNDVQRQAVEHTEGPVLIIAGAGSGKTRVLTYRIAYLLATGRAYPEQILALTFTNKAAREMQRRIEELVGPRAQHIWMGTFHALFARILRQEIDHLGLWNRQFTIYDTEDQERLLLGVIKEKQLDPKLISPRSVRHRISFWKNQLLSPEEARRLAANVLEAHAAELYVLYQKRLARANALDFDDLLLLPIRLFEQFPEVLARYQQRFRYILIDEYQDTNRAQYVVTRLLAAAHRNLCVVGDDAQAIYAFRGADIRNILSFQEDYPDAAVFRLEQNYRSTKRILRAADSVIRFNRNQLPKQLWTANPDGEPIVLLRCASEREEGETIARMLLQLRREGYPYREMAVLYRTNAQSRAIEDGLRMAAVPYQLVGGLSFYKRREIKDVLAYLRLLVNPDDEEALLRVLNVPPRGIGERTLERLRLLAAERGYSLWQAIAHASEAGISTRALNPLERFREMVEHYRAQLGTRAAVELVRDYLGATGLMEALLAERTPEAEARWENVQELLSAIAEFQQLRPEATLDAFLQEVSLLTDIDTYEPDTDRVTLMTVHAAKGLEFRVVFIAGMEEGLFPILAPDTDIEEERRLFYVGLTRARERLFLSHSQSRYRFGTLQYMERSRFLQEIDPEVLVDEQGRPIAGSGTGTLSGSDADRRVVYDEDILDWHALRPGMRVEHPQFGEGRVLEVQGSGPQARVLVHFDLYGQKKLVLQYARLRRA